MRHLLLGLLSDFIPENVWNTSPEWTLWLCLWASSFVAYLPTELTEESEVPVSFAHLLVLSPFQPPPWSGSFFWNLGIYIGCLCCRTLLQMWVLAQRCPASSEMSSFWC